MAEQMRAIPPNMTDALFYGYTTVPVQRLGAVYSREEAMKEGTLFPELNLPWTVYGKEGWRNG